MQTTEKIKDYVFVIFTEFKKLNLFEKIDLFNNIIIVETMHDEPTILTAMYKAAASQDIDIMQFTMHSNMIQDQDDDDNFITTITLQFLTVLN